MFEDLIKIIGARATAAGFRAAGGEKQLVVSDENWPEGDLENQLGYWYSDFASILLVEVPCATCVEAKQLSMRAESYLDAVLMKRERSGFVVDGYLVLALSRMNAELKSFIVEVESDTRFVRKHVVYRGGDQWERYQRITSLGLVKSMGEKKISEFVPSNAASSLLLDSLAKDGGKKLARLHGIEWNQNE